MGCEKISIYLPAGRNVDNVTVTGSHHPERVSRRLELSLWEGSSFKKNPRHPTAAFVESSAGSKGGAARLNPKSPREPDAHRQQERWG